MTPTERAKKAIEGVTEGPWVGYNMVHPDRGDALTPDEIGEYVTNSVKIGDPSRFLFVAGKHDDGRDCDICHTGNGPRGPANTRFISEARQLVPDLIAENEALRARAEAAEAKAKVLVDALEFYADRDWNGYEVEEGDYGLSVKKGKIILDEGYKARVALNQIKDSTPE